MRNALRLYKTMLGGAVAAGALLLPQAASAASCASGATRMAEILNTSSTADTLVLAHRGFWGSYAGKGGDGNFVPENSLAALSLANLECFDGVELDVKVTADGVPILMHDFNLGRTTTIYEYVSTKNKYNPMNNTGHNPAVRATNWGVISRLNLLTPDRSKSSTVFVPRVDTVFKFYNKFNFTIPMIFDAKDSVAVKAIDSAAKAAFSRPREVVAVKVNATLYNSPGAFASDAPNITAIPVFTTNMVAKIDVKTVREAWQKSVRTMEINVKQQDGLLQGQMDSALSAGQRVGVFQAIPDGPGQDQFYKNFGACCYKLSDIYYSGKEGKDTADKRGDIGYLQAQKFGLITTDDPVKAMATLGVNGRRKSHPTTAADTSTLKIPQADDQALGTMSNSEIATSDAIATSSPEPDGQ